ncbi:MAG: phytoene/squalene synthase family protein [Myxococcales bacterium FL481]|nr:MAG: phytoene/squalene synthase family protein [Myxococcales bacterium FL481]
MNATTVPPPVAVLREDPVTQPAPVAAPSSAVLQQCREALEHGSKSFAMAARILPARVRVPATIFYAFCREADDLIDEGEDPARALDQLRDRVDAVYQGHPTHARDQGLAYLVQAYGLPRCVFEALLDGFAWDVQSREMQTTTDLYDYCVRVASSVGVAICYFVGVTDRVTLARACDLGVAMQLTNIARDVGEDLGRGRVYVPTNWLPRHVPPRDSLTNATVARDMARELVTRSRVLYRRADLGLDRLPLSVRPSLRAAALIYAAIGDVVRRPQHNVLRTRAVVSTRHKLVCVARALLRTALPSRFKPEATRAVVFAPPLAEAECLLPPPSLTAPPKA